MGRRRDEDRTGYFARNAPTDVVRTPTPVDGLLRNSTLRPARRGLYHASREAEELAIFEEELAVSSIDAVGTDSVPPSWPPPPLSVNERLEEDVHDLLACAPGDEGPHIARLLPGADDALTILARRFPGPLWFDATRPHLRLPNGRDASPVAAALVAFGERSVPFVARLCESSRLKVRYYAALVAGDLPHADLLEPLGRLAMGSEASVREAALTSLQRQPEGTALDRLLASMRVAAVDPLTRGVWRVRAVRALGALRHGDATADLIQLLSDRDRPVARAAHEMLRLLTAHDFGALRRSWQRWHETSRQSPRTLWLIDGLADRRPDVRRIAALELSRLTGQASVPTEAASLESYLTLQSHYRSWWETQPSGSTPGA